MTLTDLITHGLTFRSWKPSLNNTTFKAACVRAANLAQSRFHLRIPEAFLPDYEHVTLNREYTDQDLHTLSATDDLWVLSFGPAASLTHGYLPAIDGTWDAIYHLEILTSDGVWHRRRCREFWKQPAQGVKANEYCVSLDRPWRNNTDTGLTFRLYQPEFFVNANVTEVLDGKLWDETRMNMKPLPEGFMLDEEVDDFRGRAKGPPEYFYRSRKEVAMDTPVLAPAVSYGGGLWLGPEPAGTFQYLITYGWGKKDSEWLAPGGSSDPILESAPGPESVVASVTYGGAFSPAPILALPDIDWQLGFDTAGTIRATHSGWVKRIYRKRLTFASSGGGAPTLIEAPGVYQFLAEVDGSTTSYTDTGAVVPDYQRRAWPSSGYFAFRPTWAQDKRYELDLRVRRRPRKLEIDTDTIQLDEAAVPCFLELFMSYLADMERAFDEGAGHLTNYEGMFSDVVGALVKASKVIPPETWGLENGTRRQLDARYLGKFRA